MLYFLSGLKGIDKSLYRVCQIDGANSWKKFRYVTIPLLKPTTIYVLTIRIYAGWQCFLNHLCYGTETRHLKILV